MDFVSAVIMPIVRWFWSFCALALFCSGVGGFLAALAMVDGGYWPWPALIPSFFFCAWLTWLAEPTRRKYLKWVRVDPDGRG